MMHGKKVSVFPSYYSEFYISIFKPWKGDFKVLEMRIIVYRVFFVLKFGNLKEWVPYLNE